MMHLVHAIPGRVRVRLQQRGDQPNDLLLWQQRLHALPGVSGVTVNAATRSLVVTYDPALFDPFETMELEHPSASKAQEPRWQRPHVYGPTPAAKAIATRFWEADARLSHLTGGKMDMKLAVPGVLLAAGLWELATGVEVAAATFHTLAWYSYNIFMHMHPELTIIPAAETEE